MNIFPNLKRHDALRRALAFFALLLIFSIGGRAAAVESQIESRVMTELATSGKLRVGVAFAPARTPLFVVRDAEGAPRGVPRDLGEALARSLGAPVEFFVAATTAEVATALESGAIDIGFMPADAERRQKFDFSPPFFVIEMTYLAGDGSHIAGFADVDRPEITVVGIAGSATLRAAARSLKQAKRVEAKSVDEAMAMMKAGSAQAFALTHDALLGLQAHLPGSRILDGAFQTADVAAALRKNRPAALAMLTHFIETAKAEGLLRRAFDDAGLNGLPVAP